MGKDFIEFSVSSDSGDNKFAKILFDGVLTNFQLADKLFYDPFKSKD